MESSYHPQRMCFLSAKCFAFFLRRGYLLLWFTVPVLSPFDWPGSWPLGLAKPFSGDLLVCWSLLASSVDFWFALLDDLLRLTLSSYLHWSSLSTCYEKSEDSLYRQAIEPEGGLLAFFFKSSQSIAGFSIGPSIALYSFLMSPLGCLSFPLYDTPIISILSIELDAAQSHLGVSEDHFLSWSGYI